MIYNIRRIHYRNLNQQRREQVQGPSLWIKILTLELSIRKYEAHSIKTDC